MPTYQYECEDCLSRWESIKKISERKEPESQPCPFCEKVGHVRQAIFEAPSLGDPVRLGFIRPSGDVREVLQRVQEKSPNATVKDHSTFTRL